MKFNSSGTGDYGRMLPGHRSRDMATSSLVNYFKSDSARKKLYSAASISKRKVKDRRQTSDYNASTMVMDFSECKKQYERKIAAGRNSVVDHKSINIPREPNDDLLNKSSRLKSAANNTPKFEKQSPTGKNRHVSLKKSFNDNKLAIANINKGMGDGQLSMSEFFGQRN